MEKIENFHGIKRRKLQKVHIIGINFLAIINIGIVEIQEVITS